MGKLIQIIKKNLKIMFRSKLSHLLIFIGPLIIIFLLGFFYYNDNSYNINVGFYSPQNTSLSVTYLKTLEENNFKLLIYKSKKACELGLKSGLNNVCVIFPDNFELGKKNELNILLDSSKSNIATIVENLLVTSLEKKQQELQLGLTQEVVSALNSNDESFSEQAKQINTLIEKNKELSDNSIVLSNYLSQFDFILNFDDSGISEVQNESSTLKVDVKSFISNVDAHMLGIRENLNTLDDYLKNLSLNSTENSYINTYISNMQKNISGIDVQLGILENANSLKGIEEKVKTLKKSLENIDLSTKSLTTKVNKILKKDKTTNTEMWILINSLDSSNNQVIAKISGVEIKDSQSIVNGVDFKMSSIVPDSSKHLNSIIASLLIGLIMIISLLLSSNLILIEKKSKASFRNYIVMNSGFFFLIGNFLTLLIIVFTQIASIVLVYYFLFLKTFTIEPIILLLVLLPIITFFILLGIVLGNISNNSSSNVILIFVVIFLFMSLSGTILPLEVLSSSIVSLSFLNPYLVSESIIRQILLFDMSPLTLKFEFLIIGLYIVVVFILAYMLEEITRKRNLYQIFVLIGLKIKNKKEVKKVEKVIVKKD